MVTVAMIVALLRFDRRCTIFGDERFFAKIEQLNRAVEKMAGVMP